MTEITTSQPAARPLAQMLTWIGIRQQNVSDRAHDAGDLLARASGWTVTRATGRLGFGARIYRDPRFDRHSRRQPDD